MEKAERKQKISVTGKQRFEYIYRFLQSERYDPKTVCDIGGTFATKMFFHKIYPESKIDVYNMDEDEIRNRKDFYFLDIEKQALMMKYDMIFAGDIIEHLIEPYDSVKKMCEALNENGILIITTPNIANIYNRILLLLGFSLGNYHPTMRYRFGNPFLNKGDGIYVGSHKSLFNWGGLKEMIETLDMEIVYRDGFSYYDFKPNIMKSGKTFKNQYSKIRKWINGILPVSMREGMILICRKRCS